MESESTKPSEATYFERVYSGTKDQVRQVRKDLGPVLDGCPVADDFVLLASELVTNAIVHSKSRLAGGMFTVRAEVRPGDFTWLEVEDQGGPWAERKPDDERGRGLAMVAALAGEDNWGVEGGNAPGTRLVWARLDWDGPPLAGAPVIVPWPVLGTTQGMDDGLIAARCSCGFLELADEEIIDHLELVFAPDDLTGNDGQAHEERAPLTCACGFSAITSDELDEHFLKVFIPDDVIGRDGRRHEPPGGSDGG
jgi:anti-sigma regulatory factor (Ser/Thr protein kinase)